MLMGRNEKRNPSRAGERTAPKGAREDAVPQAPRKLVPEWKGPIPRGVGNVPPGRPRKSYEPGVE